MEETFPNLLKKAQDALENPKNPEVLKILRKQRAFTKAMEAIECTTRQPT